MVLSAIDSPAQDWYSHGVRIVRFTHAAGSEWEGTWAEEAFADYRGGRWCAAARISVRDGRIIITELRVTPDERETWKLHRKKDNKFGGLSTASSREWGPQKPGEWSGDPKETPKDGLDGKALKSIRLGNFIPAVQTWITSTMTFTDTKGYSDPGAFVEMALPGGSQLTPRPRPRRNVGRDDLFYAQLAAEYVKAAATSRSPVKDIAKHRGENQAHVRDLLHEARVRGLLSQGVPGKRGGVLTPRSLTLLSERRKRSRAHKPAKHKGGR